MDKVSTQELADRFTDVVEYLSLAHHTVALEEWQGIDMTIAQIKTMVLLQNMNGTRMGGIAAYLGSTLSATTSIVDRLVDKGLVERDTDPNDRRVVVCKLTNEGRDTIHQFWYIGTSRAEAVWQRLSYDQLKSVVHSFELIREIVEDIHLQSLANDPRRDIKSAPSDEPVVTGAG